MYNIKKWYFLFLYSQHSFSTVPFTANSAFMNDFANTIFILGARKFMMVKFRMCKSVNYISATDTIITSTTGTGQSRPQCTVCHAAAPGSVPCMTCFVHKKPMKLNDLNFKLTEYTNRKENKNGSSQVFAFESIFSSLESWHTDEKYSLQ